MSARSPYPVPVWASDALDVLDPFVIFEGADFRYRDADAEFSKKAKLEHAAFRAGEDRRVFEYLIGGNHVLFVARDEEELRARVAVIEVMGS